MKRTIFILLLILLPNIGWGATVYVKKIESTVYFESGASSCGDVTTADTSGDLEDSLGAAGTNGTLYICAGTYTAADIDSDNGLDATHNGQTVRNSGPVILNTGRRANYVVRSINKASFSIIGTGGENTFILTGGKNYSFGSYNSSTNAIITVDGITVNTLGGDCAKEAGIGLQGENGYSITGEIKNSFVRDVQGMGISAANWIDSVIIEGNVISGTGSHPRLGQHGISVHATPKSIASGSSNWTLGRGAIYYTVEPAEVYAVVNTSDLKKLTLKNGKYSTLSKGEFDWYKGKLYVNIGKDPDSVTVYYTTHQCDGVIVRDNDVSYVVDADGIEGHGIAFDGFNTNCQAYRNHTHHNEGEGIQVNFGESVTLHSNIIDHNRKHGIGLLKPASGVVIANNTIIYNATAGIFNRTGRKNTVAKNNVIAHNGTYGVNQETETDGIELDYNCYYNNGNNDTYQTVKGSHRIDSDPQLDSTYTPANINVLYGGRPIAKLNGESDFDGDQLMSLDGQWPIGAQAVSLELSVTMMVFGTMQMITQ